jgi:hypothetical protein
MTSEEKGKTKSLASNISIGARVVQALFIGVFVLGVSMMVGDYSSTVKMPFSPLSLSTTMFGGLGALISEIIAQRARNW